MDQPDGPISIARGAFCPRCRKPTPCPSPSAYDGATPVCEPCRATEREELAGRLPVWRATPYWSPRRAA